MNWWAGPLDDPDRYQLHMIVGGGGEGEVWRATRHLHDGPLDVAVKLLSRTQTVDPIRDRSRWEAQVARLRDVKHPGVVGFQEGFVGAPPHEPGHRLPGEQAFLVMGFIDGPSLGDWLRTNPGSDINRRIGLLATAAGALDELHKRGFVHGDVKPDNLRIASSGAHEFAVLVDFGLMRSITQHQPSRIAGTPGFWAPEVAAGGPPTAVSDLFSFASVVFFALRGAPPSVNLEDDLRALVELPHDASLQAALRSALAADPAKRPQGVAKWLSAIRGTISSVGSPVQPQVPTKTDSAPVALRRPGRRRPLLAGLAAILLLGVGSYAVASGRLGSGGAGVDDGPEALGGVDSTETSLSQPTSTAAPATQPPTTVTTTTTVTPTTAPPPAQLSSFEPIAQSDSLEISWTGDAYSESSDYTLNGKTYSNAVRLSLCSYNNSAYVEYTLARKFGRLTAVAGQSDTSERGNDARLKIIADDRLAFEGSMKIGAPSTIDVDLRNALRLRLEVTGSGGSTFGGPCAAVIFADPLLRQT